MDASKRTATIVGVLFIIGTVAGVLSVLVTNPILEDSEYLSNVAANGNQLVVGALLVLTMGLALAIPSRRRDNHDSRREEHNLLAGDNTQVSAGRHLIRDRHERR